MAAIVRLARTGALEGSLLFHEGVVWNINHSVETGPSHTRYLTLIPNVLRVTLLGFRVGYVLQPL